MAKTIYTRTPFYVQRASSEDVVTCNIEIDGTSRYDITRQVIDGYATFEVAELIRDYVQPAYSLSEGHTEVQVTLDDASATAADVYDYLALDGYLLYTEGIQSESTVNNNNIVGLTAVNGERRLLVTDDANSNYYPLIKPSAVLPNEQVRYVDLDSSDAPSVVAFSETINIDVLDCSKYDAIPVRFINKFGVFQQFWFNLAFREKLQVESFSYNRSLVDYTNMTLDQNVHSQQRVVTGGKVSYTLNTPYLNEYYNQTIEELIFSEYVWLYIDSFWLPVHIKTESLQKKTHVNDKLIQYTIEAVAASTYLNTIR